MIVIGGIPITRLTAYVLQESTSHHQALGSNSQKFTCKCLKTRKTNSGALNLKDQLMDRPGKESQQSHRKISTEDTSSGEKNSMMNINAN